MLLAVATGAVRGAYQHPMCPSSGALPGSAPGGRGPRAGLRQDSRGGV